MSTGADTEEVEDGLSRRTTPWVRTVISGAELLRNPKYNKGFAFTEGERDRLYLRGLLPPAVISQDVQLCRAMANFRSKTTDLEKYQYLQGLHERNERLFFYLLQEHLEECLPFVHGPLVALACKRYGLMFRSLPRSLFVCLSDRGVVFPVLKNWPERRVKAIALSDGEQVGGYGDLGVQSVGALISKLSLYSAYGGVQPSTMMPVCIDCGTDNQQLLQDQFYVGTKQQRVRDDAYKELLDEFMEAVEKRFGRNIFISLEGMAWETSKHLLTQYRGEFPLYSDEFQGIPCTALAGLISAAKQTGIPLEEHVVLVSGEGAQAAAIAEMLAAYVAAQSKRSVPDVRENMWLLDSKGLVTRGRDSTDNNSLKEFQYPFAHSGPACAQLSDAIMAVKPTVLIGATEHGQPPFMFTEKVLKAMMQHCDRPVVFALSCASEVSAWEAYKWTHGNCVFAGSYSNTHPVTLEDGTVRKPTKVDSLKVAAGLCAAITATRSVALRDEQLIVAAETLAGLLKPEDAANGAVLPAIADLVPVSRAVAQAVARKAYELGIATDLPKPANLAEHIDKQWFHANYREYH